MPIEVVVAMAVCFAVIWGAVRAQKMADRIKELEKELGGRDNG